MLRSPRRLTAASIDLIFAAPFLPTRFVLLVTYRAVRHSSGTLFSLFDNDRSPILEMAIQTNITVKYRAGDRTDELLFHRRNFTANDGL